MHLTRTRRVTVSGVAIVGLAAAMVTPWALSSGGASATPAQTAPTAATAASSAAVPSLFGAAPASTARMAPDTSLTTPKRSRYVDFRASALPKTAAGQKIALPFFDDARFVGAVDHIDRQALLTSWSGPLDSTGGLWVVTEAAGRYQVTASTTQGSFTMNLTPSGAYQVNEVDQPEPVDVDDTVGANAGSATPALSAAQKVAAARAPLDTAGAILPPATRAILDPSSATAADRAAAAPAPVAQRRKGGGARGDNGSTEDILVVYTKGAKRAYGGTDGIYAEAAKNIGYTNAAYANGRVKTTARLVGVVPTRTKGKIGGGIGTDLNQLARRGDGKFDDVFKWINRTHADDTILLVAPPPRSAPVCGIAILKHNQPASTAFGVVSTGSCTDGYYSFPHELGHNQGAAHDLWTLRHDPVGRGPLDAQYRYGYGYVDPKFRFYTVMAYYSECRYVGHVSCPQVLTFSNPKIYVNGQYVTGTKSRNNVARLISKTRHRVASHQQSQLYARSAKVAIKPKPHTGRRVHVVFKGWINSGVHTKVQWYLDGQKIKGAHGRSYKVRKHDRGHQLAVIITGKKRFYAPVVIGSNSRTVK